VLFKTETLTRETTPGEISRIGRISARKRTLSPETLGKMDRKGGAAKASAYSPGATFGDGKEGIRDTPGKGGNSTAG